MKLDRSQSHLWSGAAERGGAGRGEAGGRDERVVGTREACGRDEPDLDKGKVPFLPCAPDLAHGKKGRFAVCPRSGTRQTCHVGDAEFTVCLLQGTRQTNDLFFFVPIFFL